MEQSITRYFSFVIGKPPLAIRNAPSQLDLTEDK